MLTKKSLKKLNKSDLIKYVLEMQSLIKFKKVNELNKSRAIFNIIGYNSMEGDRHNGDEYKIASIDIFNLDGGNLLNMKVDFYVPSGYMDGSEESLIGEYILNDTHLDYIKNNGFRNFCRDIFHIPYDIEKTNRTFGNILDNILE